MNKIKNLYRSLRRTGWALGLLLFGLMFLLRSGSEMLVQQANVLIWKLLLVGTAVFVAHVIRKQLFPYIDMSRVLDEDTSTKDGLVFLGLCLFYSAIVMALTQGL